MISLTSEQKNWSLVGICPGVPSFTRPISAYEADMAKQEFSDRELQELDDPVISALP